MNAYQEPLADDLKRLGMNQTASEILRGKLRLDQALASVERRIEEERPPKRGIDVGEWLGRARNVVEGYRPAGAKHG